MLPFWINSCQGLRVQSQLFEVLYVKSMQVFPYFPWGNLNTTASFLKCAFVYDRILRNIKAFERNKKTYLIVFEREKLLKSYKVDYLNLKFIRVKLKSRKTKFF